MPSSPTQVGRYQIISPIGEGGMGTLYKALDPMLDRQIAIKVLRGDDDDLRQRFAREARSAAHLRHPNIVTIFDVGEDHGQPFIAMELIQGQTLAHLIQHRTPLEVARKLELMEALCDGLGYAHKTGLIHRDIKPANLMVDAEGALKILDFGIARPSEGASLTQAGMLIGTINYMSPEQLTGQHVDSRSDIFAVGLAFYELMAYHMAFPGGFDTGIFNKILSEQPASLASVPGVTPEILRIIDRALQKAPADRYQDLATMRHDVQAARGHLEGGAATVILDVAAMPLPTPTAVTLPVVPRVDPMGPTRVDGGARAGGRRAGAQTAWMAVSTIGVAGLALAGYLEFRGPTPPPDVPADVVPSPKLVIESRATGPAEPTLDPTSTSSPARPQPPVAAAPTSPRAEAGAAADTSAALDSRITGLLDAARRSYAHQDRIEAMASVHQALQLRSDDRRTRELLILWLGEATTETEEAQATAEGVGPMATTTKSYLDATARQGAATHTQTDHPDRAIQSLWDASALFGQAADQGRKAATAAAKPTPPAPIPTSPPATVPPPAPTAPAAESVKPVPPPVDEAGDVRKVLDAYAQAERALDAEAVHRVFSKAPADLKQAFGRLKSQTFELNDIQITVTGSQATVHAVQNVAAAPKNGDAVRVPASPRTFTLAKTSGAWVITDIK